MARSFLIEDAFCAKGWFCTGGEMGDDVTYGGVEVGKWRKRKKKMKRRKSLEKDWSKNAGK